MSIKSNTKGQKMLNVIEDPKFIYVEGEIFKYRFSKRSGLINSINILGNDFLKETGSEIPDIFISNAGSPNDEIYTTKYEQSAECEILSANPYEVNIRSHGVYHNSMGKPFPARYRITYEIENDGNIFIIVDNKITDDCEIKWLCISKAKLNPLLCKYFVHLDDLSKSDTTARYFCDEIKRDGLLFNGDFIPWCWFGNDEVGIEISVWDIGYQRYGTRLISNDSEENAPKIGVNLSASVKSGEVTYKIMAINGKLTRINSGWEHTAYFALSITPSKIYNPSFSDMLVWRSETYYPSEEQIKNAKNKGFNLMILPIKYFGKADPNEKMKTDKIVSIAHENGVKVVPYINVMQFDRSFCEVFDEHLVEWQIEPSLNNDSIAFACPGAEGWREYWKSRIDKIIDESNFDGIFLDIYYDKLACKNALHGCQRKYIRPTFIWAKEMIKHAYIKAKRKSQDLIVIANTDIMPLSTICSCLDVRCSGISSNINNASPIEKKLFYNSFRLGCNSLTNFDKINHLSIANSILFLSPPIISDRNLDESSSISQYWDILRFFGINKAKLYLGFIDNPLAVSKSSDIFVNIFRNESLLLTLVNLSDNDTYTEIEIEDIKKLNLDNNKHYIVYEPLAQQLCSSLQTDLLLSLIYETPMISKIFVPKYGVRSFFICNCDQNPILLFAMGSDGVIDQVWDEGKSALKAEISAHRNVPINGVIYFPTGKPFNISVNGQNIDFTWDDQQKLAFFNVSSDQKTIIIKAQRIDYA
ncbi:MAG: hypothetical protein ACPL7B_13055 [Candidatus Poribacteria bacterium]